MLISWLSDHEKRSQNGVKTQTSVNGVKLTFLRKQQIWSCVICGSRIWNRSPNQNLNPFCNQKRYFVVSHRLWIKLWRKRLFWNVASPQYEMSKHVSKSHIQSYCNQSLKNSKQILSIFASLTIIQRIKPVKELVLVRLFQVFFFTIAFTKRNLK